MGVTRKPLILQHNKLRSVLSSFPHSAQLLHHHHGPRDSGAQDSGGCGLPCLHVSQGGVARVPGERGGLAQVLGGPRCLLPGGAHPGPLHQPHQLLLPHIPGVEVSLPGLVHASSSVEWSCSPLQPSSFPTFQRTSQRDRRPSREGQTIFKDKFGDFFKSDKKENGKENGKKNGVVVKTKDKP